MSLRIVAMVVRIGQRGDAYRATFDAIKGAGNSGPLFRHPAGAQPEIADQPAESSDTAD